MAKSSLVPACIGTTLEACDDLAHGVKALAHAARTTCELVDESVVGLKKIASLTIAAQIAELEASLVPA